MPPDFTDAYNTPLSVADEAKFRAWATSVGKERDLADYDLRGAWKAGLRPTANGHLPDTYKKPNHPTFSNESIYSGRDGEHGGVWQGDTFVVGPSNRRYWSPEELTAYMQKNEKGVTLANEARPAKAKAVVVPALPDEMSLHPAEYQ